MYTVFTLIGTNMEQLSDEKLTSKNKKSPKAKLVMPGENQDSISHIESPKPEKKSKVKKELDLSALENINNEPEQGKKKGKKPSSVVGQINQHNLNSTYSYTYSEEHISILFHNAKLLTVNQLFTILQNSKFNIFNYKKICHGMVKKVLAEIHQEAKNAGVPYPFFTSNAEIILYRRGIRMVDEDSLSTMFKYIIDALRKNDDIYSADYSPYGILQDDNPKIIQKVTSYAEKGEPSFGIQIKRCKELKPDFVAEDILVHKN